jgi:anaerobic ribonucleoside-triphosphate reductase activating protein
MNYIKIDSCNMNNGSGLRCVVWVSGCNHHCKNCFNPETWDSHNGDEFGEEQFNFVCDTLRQPWCSGITFTGGDPLCQDNTGFHIMNQLALTARSLGKTVWLWTGFKWEDIWNDESDMRIYRQNLISLCDVVVDGQYVDSLRDLTLKWRGSSNQRVILSRMSINQKEPILMEGT